MSKQILSWILSAFCLFLLLLSCRKEFFSEGDDSSARKEEFFRQRFFYAPPGTSVMALRIQETLKNKNLSDKYYDWFAQKNGYPVWNKLQQFSGRNLISSVQNNNQDTVIIIPLVLDSTNYVNGYIKAVVTDSISISYQLASEYVDMLPGGNNNSLSAEQFATRFFELNKLVFGHTKFKLTDRRLFNTQQQDTTKHVFRFAEIRPDEDSLNNYVMQACYNVLVEWICQECYRSSCPLSGSAFMRVCEDFETGGNPIPPKGGSTGGAGVTYSGWEPVQTQDPVHQVPDSIPNILARACDQKSDSIFNSGLQNCFREEGFILVKKNGAIYPKNFVQSPCGGVAVSMNYNLSVGEKLVGYLHCHSVENDYRMRSTFSAKDIQTLFKNRNIPGYTALLECGNVRYALVVEDVVKQGNFVTNHLGPKLNNTLDSLITANPNYWTNGQLASEQALIQLLGSVGINGIGFYKAIPPNKNNFIKLNP